VLVGGVRAAEMADIASSTSTGVFVMTRTTGSPGTPSRSATNAVMMPAAPEMTRRSSGMCGASSSSSAAMSCGLTVRMSVSALFAASALDTAATP